MRREPDPAPAFAVACFAIDDAGMVRAKAGIADESHPVAQSNRALMFAWLTLCFTTLAFVQSGPRWLGISDLIAEPEGPTFISYKVARSRLDELRFVTQDPTRTSDAHL